MTIELKKFSSHGKFNAKTRDVEGIRLNKANAKEVAKWCKGNVVTDSNGDWYLELMKGSKLHILTTGWWIYRTPGKKTFSLTLDKEFKKKFYPVK